MGFRFIKHVCSVVCGVVALPAFACELPKLPVIPAADQIGDRAPDISEATSAYFDGIREYASCIQEELAAAGGDAAPASIRSVLIARANVAVAEAQVVQQLFQERVAAGQTATPGSEAALRKLIEGIASGTPDYDAMTEDAARTMRQQAGFLRGSLAAAGEIRSIQFAGVDPQGRNIFQVQHENSTTQARIALADDGKVEFAMLRPQPPAGERRPTARIPPRR
jgi:hypothetical protein